jgi:hypothetical protein
MFGNVGAWSVSGSGCDGAGGDLTCFFFFEDVTTMGSGAAASTGAGVAASTGTGTGAAADFLDLREAEGITNVV